MSLARLCKERQQILAGGCTASPSTSTAAALTMPTISPALRRLRSELESLDGVSSKVTVSSADPYQVEVCVLPKSGIWRGGTFHFVLLFDDEFPAVGPKIRYTGPYRVFHPNIEGEAEKKDWGVCLGLQSDWRPVYTIADLVVGLEMLFTGPTYEDPLPGVAKEAAQMLKEHPDEFKKKATMWMKGQYV